MGEITKIEWCHHTFNPWIGCTKVAPECANCYAEELMAKRWKKVGWGDKAPRSRTTNWKEPLKWNRDAEAASEHRRVFCASLADVFEDKSELVDWRRELFELIDKTPWLDWLLLTKRPENIRKMWILPKMEYHDLNIPANDTRAIERLARRNNVWLGTSCGHEDSTQRIRDLMRCREISPLLFLSMEPLLTPVRLTRILKTNRVNGENSIDWIIVGGESGKNPRYLDIEWIRQILGACRLLQVPCFVKQLGSIVRTDYYELDEAHREHAMSRMVREIGVDPGFQPGGAAQIEWKPVDKKGGNPDEWPADLRVREFPKGEAK